MFSLHKSLLLAAAVGSLAILPSCDDDVEIVDLELEVRMAPGGVDYVAGDTYTINGKAVQFSSLSFYLTDPSVTGGGTTFATDAYVLAKPNTSVVVGQVESGDYSSFTFNLGIDSATNHADPTTYPTDNVLAPQSPNHHWSWASGYIFLRIDGMFDGDGDGTPETAFETHLGTDNFYTPLTLNGTVEGHDDHVHVELVFDPIALYDGTNFGSDASDDMTFTTHTMDNMPMAMMIRSNFANAFSLGN